MNLQEAVLKQLGHESMTEEALQELGDIAKGGIDGGFHGFTYHADTVEFFDNNRELILSSLQEMADSCGEDILKMVTGFNCLKSHNLTPTDIMAGIYEKGSEHEVTVKNALAWYAGEEVAFNLEV